MQVPGNPVLSKEKGTVLCVMTTLSLQHYWSTWSMDYELLMPEQFAFIASICAYGSEAATTNSHQVTEEQSLLDNIITYVDHYLHCLIDSNDVHGRRSNVAPAPKAGGCRKEYYCEFPAAGC